MEEERLSFPQRLVQMIEAQSFEQLIFIIVLGLGVVGVVVAVTFLATRGMKSPHEK